MPTFDAQELYVYYRAEAAAAPQVFAAVREFQHQLQVLHPGLITRVLRREIPEPHPADPGSGASHTWMEVYCFGSGKEIPASLEAALESLAAKALSPWLEGRRHSERFLAHKPPTDALP